MTDAPRSIIRWETPAPRRPSGPQGRNVLGLLVQDLRSRPGRWALVCTYKNAVSAQSRANRLKKYLGNEYEFCSRCLPDGRGGCYGRFIGK